MHKHIDYVGYTVRTNFELDEPIDLEVIAFVPDWSESPFANMCDFCDRDAAYEVDAESVLGEGGHNVFYCQPCATLEASSPKNPDTWIAPKGA